MFKPPVNDSAETAIGLTFTKEFPTSYMDDTLHMGLLVGWVAESDFKYISFKNYLLTKLKKNKKAKLSEPFCRSILKMNSHF